jgi:hypothetical protein
VNDTEFEQRLKTLLNDKVDAELGDRRAAPPFVATTRRRPRSRWVVPLLAAACVVVVVAATFGLVAVFRAGGNEQPARPPGGTVVMFAGARLALPAGWTSQRSHGPSPGVLCIEPGPGSPSSTKRGCAISLAVSRPQGHARGSGGGAQFTYIGVNCARTAKLVEHVGVVSLGGRAADHTRADYACPDGSSSHLETYLAEDFPVYSMSTLAADPSVTAAMTYIAKHSLLPRPDKPLPGTDYGKVIAVTHTPDGDRITLQRELSTGHAPGGTTIVYGVRPDVQTDYDLTPVYKPRKDRLPPPSPQTLARLRVHVGDHLMINTDGTEVVSYRKV